MCTRTKTYTLVYTLVYFLYKDTVREEDFSKETKPYGETKHYGETKPIKPCAGGGRFRRDIGGKVLS